MILWFANIIIVLAMIAALLCLVYGLRKQGPNDFTLGATALTGVLLIVQIIIAIVAPLTGNPPTGDLLEFWLYLIVAVALPIGGVFWALIDRTRWSNIVLAVLNVAAAVMVFRMLQIWFVQQA